MRARITLTVLALCVLSLCHGASTSDASTEHKPVVEHQIGLNIFSAMNLEIFVDRRFWRPVDVSLINGLSYKYYRGKNGFRIGFDAFRYERIIGPRPAPPEPFTYHYTEHQLSDLEARVGYERRIGTGKIQGHWGLDLSTRHINTGGWFEFRSNFPQQRGYSGTGQVDIKAQYVIISPLAGISYRPVERISISAEMRILFGSGRIRNRQYGDRWEKDSLALMDPIRAVCLYYHFR